MAYDNLKLGDKIRLLYDDAIAPNDGTYIDITKEVFSRNDILKNKEVGYDANFLGEDAFGILFEIVRTPFSPPTGKDDYLSQNGNPFNGIFGGALVEQRVEQFSANFSYPPDSRGTITDILGTGTVGIVDSLFVASTGTTTGSTVNVETKRNLRYKAGRDAEGMFTGIFTAGSGDSRINVGLFDELDGFAIGTIGSEFAVFRRNNGTWVDEITQDNFNKDKLDGTGASRYILDITKLNIFRITYGYLGIAPIYYQVFGGEDKGWITFHIIDLTNEQTNTHVESPYLPLTLRVDNGTTTDNVVFQSGSVYAGIFGQSDIRDASARRFSVDIADFTTSGTSEETFAVFHNKDTFAGETNKIESILAIFQAALDASAKPAKVRIWNVPVADITGGTFEDVDTLNSTLEYSDSGIGLPTVVLTNATLYTVFTIAKDGNVRLDVENLEYVLFPGEYVAFTIESNNNTIIDSSIDEIELF